MDRHRIARQTSIVNAVTNTLLAVFKLLIGWIGNSSALVADGIHSFSDLISDGLVYIASKAGTKHPDEGHPYGHQRIETMGAIVIALLFMAAGGLIVYEAILHLIAKEALHQPTVWVVIVAAASVLANEWLYRYTLKKGQLIYSNLVISNALHNRSDVYVSVIVLISVGLAYFGIGHFDAIGAIIVALLIVKMGLKMVWESLNELLDAAVDQKTLDKIRHFIECTPGVRSVHQLRTRQHGGSILVDVHILVNPKISVSEGHHISDQVGLDLMKNLKKISDVTVHIDPEDDEVSMPSVGLPSRQTITDQLRICWQSLPGSNLIDTIHLHYLNGKLQIEIVLPMALTKDHDPLTLQKQYEEAANKRIKQIESIKIFYH